MELDRKREEEEEIPESKKDEVTLHMDGSGLFWSQSLTPDLVDYAGIRNTIHPMLCVAYVLFTPDWPDFFNSEQLFWLYALTLFWSAKGKARFLLTRTLEQ